MRQTVVTAVIPVYGREDVFGTMEALDGFPHEGVDLRAIVVDNGNAEALANRLFELPRRYAWCTVVRLRENRGGAGAFRAGMAVALRQGGDFVWLLDDDALVNERTLPGLLAEYQRLEQSGVRVGAVGSTLLGRKHPNRVTEVGGAIGKLSGRLRLRLQGADIRSVGQITVETEYVAAASLLVRTGVLRDVGLFEDIFIHYDDVEWCFRLRRAGYRNFATTHSTVAHAEWEGKIAPWVLYYDARNLLRFLRRYRLLACVLTRLRLWLQKCFLTMHGAGSVAHLITLGVQHARTGELLTRRQLPEPTCEQLPTRQFLHTGETTVVLAQSGHAADYWKTLAADYGATVRLLRFEGLGVAKLLKTGIRHLVEQCFLLTHPEASLLFDFSQSKRYPFPFWCRHRAFFRIDDQSMQVFVYATNKMKNGKDVQK